MLSPDFFKSSFEVTCFLLFIVCFFHSYSKYGFQKTFREFLAGFILSAGCENLGVLSGAYVYPGFHFYVFEIPLVNPLSWIALVYLVMEITNRLFPLKNRRFLLYVIIVSLIDSTLALSVDLMMDPLATIYNWWIWVPVDQAYITEDIVNPYNFDLITHVTTPDNPISIYFENIFSENRYPTRLFGIPLINFIAWFVFVFVFSIQFRWIESKISWSHYKKLTYLLLLILIEIPILGITLITPNI